MTQDTAVLAEAACALLALHVAPRGRRAAVGALQTPPWLVLQADANVLTRLAAFGSRRDAEAAGPWAIKVVMDNAHGDVVGRDRCKEILQL